LHGCLLEPPRWEGRELREKAVWSKEREQRVLVLEEKGFS
jgi:hypothetical protein